MKKLFAVVTIMAYFFAGPLNFGTQNAQMLVDDVDIPVEIVPNS